METMRILMEEVLRQVVMRWILVLECLLLGARGRLWPCPIVPSI
jgi:hypothetical protein